MNYPWRANICGLLLFVLVIAQGYAQQGDYFVQNYLPKDYPGGQNNNGVTQNNEGLIFFANMNGVLIYDGLNWEICKRADEITIQSIAKTASGEIVVGTEDGDIAKISKNEKGKFIYTSLLEKIPENQRPHNFIRQILVVGKKTFFLSPDKLVEYDNSKLKFYEPTESFHARAMVMGGHLFVTDVHQHISVVVDGKLLPVEGTQELSHERHFSCNRISANNYAIGYRGLGFLIARVDSVHPTRSTFLKKSIPGEEELIGAEINNGCQLRNGNFLLTTNKKGAFELDANLNILRRFDSRNGVYDDNIKAAFQDVNGNLWLALFYGISLIETNSKIYHYGRNNGISGVVQSACYFENKLLVATDKGVQYYDSVNGKFNLFHEFNKQSWYLFPLGKRLFIGTAKGLFVFTKDAFSQLSENETFFLLNDPIEENAVYAGTAEGVDAYQVSEKGIQLRHSFNLGSPIKTMASDHNNNTYFVSVLHTVYFLNHDKNNTLDSLSQADALPQHYFETSVFSYNKKLMLGTDTGIYSLKKISDHHYKCVKDPEFWQPTKSAQIFRAAQLSNGIICSQKYVNNEKNIPEEKITLLAQSPFTSKIKTRILNHLSHVTPNAITYDSTRRLVFICANEGLFFLTTGSVEKKTGFHLILKRLITKNDTLLENCSENKEIRTLALTIPYQNNDLKVILGFTSYETSSGEFSYKLEGRDSKFSKWDQENILVCSNLAEGNYKLIVKARTELEDRVYVLEIPFRVSPPWYRSAMAYVIYIVLFLVFIYILLKLNSRRLVDLNKKLEKTIEERTKIISHQKEELEFKQKEIVDSINYAQRIQGALLANDKILQDNLPDHFVFFQPKDVVSGDFYWASTLANGQFALVTADSTGHGVPGAIMSMLNISCLEKAIEVENLIEPAEILNHARIKVIETLKKDGSAEGGKDGMDCCLVSFDLKKHTLTYAAAHNPVWIVRRSAPASNSNLETDLQLLEFPPDKMPVGKHDHDHIPFKQHTVELQKGDMVYTLTDGLPDQFGGPKGKKFMYKKLKELLLSMAHLPLTKQKSLITHALKDWMGALEQVDDICVIGVRV